MANKSKFIRRTRFMPKAASQTAPDNGNDRISTRASSVYDRLQSDILTGKLEPGLKLRLKDLIKQYDTGNSPLREALNRLSANGMVVREENRGFRVPPASNDELKEITRTRCWRIVLAFHWLARAARSTDEATRTTSPEWEEHHREFHLALISACNSSILIDFCTELHLRSFRYRNLAEVVKYRDRHELEEHEELQTAVLNRDADKAVELLKKHYTVTSEILVDSGRFD
jgi:DNA-binding GntR family transcriptional regulator